MEEGGSNSNSCRYFYWYFILFVGYVLKIIHSIIIISKSVVNAIPQLFGCHWSFSYWLRHILILKDLFSHWLLLDVFFPTICLPQSRPRYVMCIRNFAMTFEDLKDDEINTFILIIALSLTEMRYTEWEIHSHLYGLLRTQKLKWMKDRMNQKKIMCCWKLKRTWN